MGIRLTVAGLMVLAVTTVACSDDQRAASTTPPATSNGVPPSTTPLPTTSTTSAPTTTSPPSTTLPSLEVVTRPCIDPAVCAPGAKAEYVWQGSNWVPFAVGPPQPMPLQVFAQPTDGVAKPFAVVLRLSTTSNVRANDHPVTINGAEVSIDMVPNGNGSAAWTLPDGSWAYLRSRDLDQEAIVALIGRLTPRDHTAPIPGFDLTTSAAVDDLVLLHEHHNTDVSGTVTRFQCTITPNTGIYRVDAMMGDPLCVYFGIIDRPRPYAAAVNGTGALVINGPADRAITPTMVINADPETWNALRPIAPDGT